VVRIFYTFDIYMTKVTNMFPETLLFLIIHKPFKSHKCYGIDPDKSLKKTPWPQSASELHRPSDRRLSAKLVPTFCGQRVPRGQRGKSLRPCSRLSRPEPLLFLPSSSSVVLTRLSGPCSRPITFFFLVVPWIRTQDLRTCSQEL
jgi:hypothetical protein